MRVIQSVSLSATIFLLGASLIVFGSGCSSGVKKVNYDTSANPSEEVQRLEQDVESDYGRHYDLLATDDFADAQKYLESAKHQLSENKSKQAFESMGYARAYLNRADKTVESLQGPTRGILEARSAALTAGARDFPKENESLRKLDEDVRAEIGNIESGRTTPERWAQLQKGYLTLELKAIQDAKLHMVNVAIDGAIRNGAKQNAPNMLAQAEKDRDSARNVIGANRHDDQAIDPAVDKASESAKLLVEVLAATKRPGGLVDEDSAREIVLKNRELKSINGKLQDSSSEASAEGRQLERQNQELKAADASLALNKAIEDARKKFTSNEAEVYRQGKKLLIRLKTVDFPVGRSDLPAHSLALLAKVKGVVDELNPSQIVIQGHTDSTGKGQTNKVLSQHRADAVAKYFASNGIDKDRIQTVGLGYEKPLGSNKSKAGRAENRRVDVIITPGTESPQSDSTTL